MLVLSRKRDESILIGDTIKITVVDIRGDKVRFGIDAPREMSVHRDEVLGAVRRERDERVSAKFNRLPTEADPSGHVVVVG